MSTSLLRTEWIHDDRTGRYIYYILIRIVKWMPFFVDFAGPQLLSAIMPWLPMVIVWTYRPLRSSWSIQSVQNCRISGARYRGIDFSQHTDLVIHLRGLILLHNWLYFTLSLFIQIYNPEYILLYTTGIAITLLFFRSSCCSNRTLFYCHLH